MKLPWLSALLTSALLPTTLASALYSIPSAIIPGAHIIPASDTATLKHLGGHHHHHRDRRTVTIRPSRNDTDDISRDFLWGMKRANHGGRLLLQKGKKYVIGKKLDLTFLDDVEVQLDGEILVYSYYHYHHYCWWWCGNRKTKQLINGIVHRRHRLLAIQPLLLRLPEVHHILGVGRQRHQDLRIGCAERQRPALVQRICWQGDPRPGQCLLSTDPIHDGQCDAGLRRRNQAVEFAVLDEFLRPQQGRLV